MLAREDTGSKFHVEHIIATSHEGRTVAENLCLSCAKCNLFKGVNIAAADPETGEPTFMFHPRRQHWNDHFHLNVALIEPLTPEGRVTIFLLRLNDPVRVEQRTLLIEAGRYPCQSP